MNTKRSKVYRGSRNIFGLWLLLACIGILLSLLLSYGRVSANDTWPPLEVVTQPALVTGAGDIHQEPIVEVEVDVRDEQDVALLQRLGYACEIGVCQLELREGEEQALFQHGLTVRITARAILLSGGKESIDAGMAPDGEYYEYASEVNGPDITDWDIIHQMCGSGYIRLRISGAPEDANISNVKYGLRIVHQHVGDLIVYFSWLKLWDRQGGSNDGGYDDDPELDDDIELFGENNFLNGFPVNNTYDLSVHDCAWWNTGYIDYWFIYVYYWICESTDIPAPPAAPFPSNGATNVSLNADLDWRDSSRATSYDVFFDTTTPPTFKGNTLSSSYALDELEISTHYYWQIVPKNHCASVNGPVWEFTSECPTPSIPSWVTPANSAKDVLLSADLDWRDASGATSYDVFFDKSNPPRKQVSTTSSSYDPGVLSFNTQYYWKIAAKNDCGFTSGPVWDFSTTDPWNVYLPVILKQE